MHKGSLLICFFHKGGWKPRDLHNHHTHTPPKQLHPLALAQPLPADGVLGVQGSSPCTFCTSKFCEMLVLNLCIRISGFSKACICQRFIRMMCRSSSILQRSRKKELKPVLLLLHLPCVRTLSWSFVATSGKKKRKVPSSKDWQNCSMNYEFPVSGIPFKFWLHTL